MTIDQSLLIDEPSNFIVDELGNNILIGNDGIAAITFEDMVGASSGTVKAETIGTITILEEDPYTVSMVEESPYTISIVEEDPYTVSIVEEDM